MRRFIIWASLLVVDILIVTVVPFISFLIRFEGTIPQLYLDELPTYILAVITVCLATFYLFGLYHTLWRYAGIQEMLRIVAAVTVSSVLLLVGTGLLGMKIPFSVQGINGMLIILLLGGSRVAVRLVRRMRQANLAPSIRVLIIGAGDAAAMIAREINQRYYQTKTLVGFIDDDPYKQQMMMYGGTVIGTRNDIMTVVQQHGVTEIIVAMPSVKGTVMRDIMNTCKQTACAVKTLPGLYELIDGQVTIQQLRNIDIEDLLGRDPVQLDLTEITSYIQGKVVLVTGAGGSIGSELSRQIAKLQPRQLLLLGKGENSIYDIDAELRAKYPNHDMIPLIADVRDKDRINSIFEQYRPQVVFHAAAHKHVPLMEVQPVEAVGNNIFGTKNVAEAADRFHTDIFIMVSTDKAVNPTSVMGATKRAAELIVQHMNTISSTKYAAVRFGNVLGSRGSVVPLFKKQIAAGGPLTITHPDMVRYFMTIPEACQLVLQAGSQANGGEVFVLDMGEPVKILEMAVDLIRLSGLVPYKDISIKFTGLRPGEKLFEELLTAEEGTRATRHEKIFVANLRQIDQAKLTEGLYRIQLMQEPDEIIAALEALLPTYRAARAKYGQTA